MQLRSAVKMLSSDLVLVMVLMLGVFSNANATVILTLERLSDTQGSLTGTGTSDFSGVYFGLQGAATTGDAGTDPVGGDFTIGGTSVTTSFVVSGDTLFLFRPSDFSISAGDVIAGTALFTLDAEIWAAIGTTGTVSVYNSDSSAGYVGDTGRYSIVAAVPEPGTIALITMGLSAFGIGAVRRRRC